MERRILVVDDDKEWVEWLAGALERRGYRVLEGFDGLQVVSQAIKVKPDLIVLDILMPTGGVKALKELRENDLTSALPIIIITAAADPGIRETVEMFGVKGYFLKPFEMSDFLKTIEEILANAKTIAKT